MSNIDFFQIGALKVFAELGQLIEEDELKQVNIEPNSWNEHKTEINLEYIKDYINNKYKLKCNKLKIMFLVSKKITYQDFVINVYHNETKILLLRAERYGNKLKECNKNKDNVVIASNEIIISILED